MTDDDYDALSQKQLASIKRDMRISLEDAAVRATYKVMAELETEQTQGEEHMTWPFPPPSGPVPWSKAQEKQYQQQQRSKLPDAPL